jgi:hypothetical protein
MPVTVKMPIAVYLGFVGRCQLSSREYVVLKNAVVAHVPEDTRYGNVVEILCSTEDAKLILDRASKFYPSAAPYIEESITADLQASMMAAEYRKISELVLLRDHPGMTYRGMHNWPPVWVHTRSDPYKKLTREVGVLIGTRLGGTMPRRLFLVMEFENKRYLGCLMFDDAPFCNQVNDFLQNHFGTPIKEIGDLDLSFLSYARLHS